MKEWFREHFKDDRATFETLITIGGCFSSVVGIVVAVVVLIQH